MAVPLAPGVQEIERGKLRETSELLPLISSESHVMAVTGRRIRRSGGGSLSLPLRHIQTRGETGREQTGRQFDLVPCPTSCA